MSYILHVNYPKQRTFIDFYKGNFCSLSDETRLIWFIKNLVLITTTFYFPVIFLKKIPQMLDLVDYKILSPIF